MSVTTVVSEQLSTGVTACITLPGDATPQIGEDPVAMGLFPDEEAAEPLLTGWLPTAAQTARLGSQTCSGGREVQRCDPAAACICLRFRTRTTFTTLATGGKQKDGLFALAKALREAKTPTWR